MKLILQNSCVNEFLPGCDFTVVNMDFALVAVIAKRVAVCQAMLDADRSLAELRYWDASPQCIGSLVPSMESAIEHDLDQGGGWAVLDEDSLGSFKEAHADCTHMVIVACDSPSVAWSYRVGSEPIRTIDVPLADLVTRLGSPPGDPLRELP